MCEWKLVYDLIFLVLREKLGVIDARVGSSVGEASRVFVFGCGLG